LGIAGFCLINAGVLYLYFSNYLQIDEEEYGGTWELTKEGFMTSFALFMVCIADSYIVNPVVSQGEHTDWVTLCDWGVPFSKRLQGLEGISSINPVVTKDVVWYTVVSLLVYTPRACHQLLHLIFKCGCIVETRKHLQICLWHS